MCGRNFSLSILEAVNGCGRGGAASRCIWRGDHELKLSTGNQILLQIRDDLALIDSIVRFQ